MIELDLLLANLALGMGLSAVAQALVGRKRLKKQLLRKEELVHRLQIREHADLPNLWNSFELAKVYLDTGHRSVLLGTVPGYGECVLKIAATDTSSPVDSFGLFREAFVLNWLAGDGAPRLLSFVNAQDGRSLALAMTPAEGSSLADRMPELTPPRLSEIHSYMLGLCTRVSQLHAKGFVHGDIKPSNLICQWKDSTDGPLLAPAGDITIVDYESASPIAKGPEGAIVGFGSVRGTRGFTAPERFYRFESAPTIDVYSCGVLAGFLLTLAPRRPGSAARRRITALAWRDLVQRATSADPSDRPRSIDEFLAEWIRGYSEMDEQLKQSRAEWPSEPTERLMMLGESRALQSVFEPLSDRRGMPWLLETTSLSGKLTRSEQATFQDWVHGPRDSRVGVSPNMVKILRKLERNFFEGVAERYPNLSTLLALDTF